MGRSWAASGYICGGIPLFLALSWTKLASRLSASRCARCEERFPARESRHDRHQVRLWRRAVRRLHGACRRRGRALLRDAGVLAGRHEHRPGRLAGGAQGRRRGSRLGRRRLLRLGQVHALPRRRVGRRGLRAEAQDPRRDQRAASGEEADRQSDAHQGDQSGDDRVLLPLGLRHGAGASSRLGSTAGSGPLPLSPRHPEARNRTSSRRSSTGRTTAGSGEPPIGAPCLA